MRSKRKGQPFIDDLLPNETILWIGQPIPWILFTAQDIFLIPVSLVWSAWALFWGWNLLHLNVIWPVGVALLSLSAFVTVGRFIYKYFRKRATYYAITERRVLILNRLWYYNLHSFFIDSLPALNKRIGRTGIGSVTFGLPTAPQRHNRAWAMDFSNTGGEVFGFGSDIPGFYDIKDVDRVYWGLAELRDALDVTLLDRQMRKLNERN